MKKTFETAFFKAATVMMVYLFVLGPARILQLIDVETLYEILNFAYAPFYLVPYVLVMAYLGYAFSRHFEFIE